MRRLSRGGAREEQGAVIVLMTVFIVVIVGMAALVVDVGAVLDERRQLQNGADAGALAVAHSCALAACDVNLAEGLADANARDSDSAVDSVTYPAANRVRVTTSTRGGGTNILPYSFGQVMSGVKGKTVRATTTASWGPPASVRAIPLALSQCDVQQLGIGVYNVIRFKGSSGPCSGKDAPGAFGWLDNACPTATYTAGTAVRGDPGSSGPKDCLVPLLGKDILVPVYDTVTGNGSNTLYRIVGFAALRLTGWRFPGDRSNPAPCGSSETCIAGTFVRVVTTASSAGGTAFGVSRVFLVS